MKPSFPWQIFEKSSNTKFHENSSSGSRVVSCGHTADSWTDGLTDMTELIVAFRNSANALKNNSSSVETLCSSRIPTIQILARGPASVAPMQITLPTKYSVDPNLSLLMNTGSSLLRASTCLIYVHLHSLTYIPHPQQRSKKLTLPWQLARSFPFLRETSKQPPLVRNYLNL